MQITGDINEFHKLTRDIGLSEKVMKQATVSSVNKSITSIRAFGVKAVAKDYKLTQKIVRGELVIVRASYQKMEARIIGDGSPGVALVKFAPTPKRTPSTRRTKRGKYTPADGIKVMIRRGQRKVVKGAFMAEMQSGHIGVFKRSKEKNLPIDELFGPSPLRIIDRPKYKKKIETFAGEVMDKNMAHEAEYYLKKAGVLQNV